MPFNTKGSFTLDLSLFGSLVTDMAPTDLPAGGSPANSDCFYLPGGVYTRPALEYLFSNIKPATPCMSVIDFPLASGGFDSIYLDSAGGLWIDNPESPGNDVQIDNSITPGSQFKAEVYGGKLWMALFNPSLADTIIGPPGFTGFDIPRYFDGAQMWRVTSDAPGGGLSFSSLPIPTATVATAAGSLVRSGNIVTCKLAGTSPSHPTPIQPSWWVTLADLVATPGSVPPAGTNDLFQLLDASATVTGDGTGNITVQTSIPLINLPVGAWFYYVTTGGVGVDLTGQTFSYNGNGTETITVPSPNVFSQGQQVQIIDAFVGSVPVFVGNPVVTIISTTSSSITFNYASGGGPQNFTSGSLQLIASYGQGYAQVTAVSSPTSFQFTIPGNANTTSLGATIYDIFGIQPSVTPGAQGLAQSFQVLSVNTASTPNTLTWYQLGPNNTYTGADVISVIPTTALPAGQRRAVVIFKSQNGALTAPSVPVTLSTNGGSTYLEAATIPLGPYGTVARIVAFTAAGGSTYFYLTAAAIPVVGGLPPLTTIGTVINDNTSTTFTFDFADTALLAGTAIDIEGNNLFNQDDLLLCLGVIEYDGRLGWWGEINNIKNLVNMGFDGGRTGPLGAYFTLPLGWDATEGDSAGYLVAQGPAYLGFAYQMVTGYNNKIEQSAYEDYYGAPVFEPTLSYFARVIARASQTGQAGNLIVDIFVPSSGISANPGTIIAEAVFPLSELTTANAWQAAEFNHPMPMTIPPDAVMRVYLSGTTEGQGTVTIDELEIIDSNYPVLFDQMILSYYQNPFGYDLITGILSVDPSEPLAGAFRQRGSLYILGTESLFQAQNNGTTEPNGWNVIQYATSCGCSGPNAVDSNEDLAWWVGRYGGRIFDGNPITKKITQELDQYTQSMNWAAQVTAWVRNDPVDRLLLFGLPTSGASMPNVLLEMSYRLSDNTYNIPDPVHVSQYSGKLICTDLGRRWSPWQLPINCAAMCTRAAPGGGYAKTLVLGNGTGLTPPPTSQATLYTLDTVNYPPLNPPAAAWNCTDADYGQIGSFYTTYFFFPKDIDQNPILSLYRKLYHYLSAHLTGVGQMQITPYIDSLSTRGPTLPIYALTLQDTGYDIEWHPNIRGDRVAWKFQPVPWAGQRAAAMALTHLQVTGRADRIFPIRGSIFVGGV